MTVEKFPPFNRNIRDIFSDLILSTRDRNVSSLGLMQRINSRRCGPAARNSSNVMHATRREQRRAECLVSRHCFQFRDNSRRERASPASRGYLNVVTSRKPSEGCKCKISSLREISRFVEISLDHRTRSSLDRYTNFRIPRDSGRYSSHDKLKVSEFFGRNWERKTFFFPCRSL